MIVFLILCLLGFLFVLGTFILLVYCAIKHINVYIPRYMTIDDCMKEIKENESDWSWIEDLC